MAAAQAREAIPPSSSDGPPPFTLPDVAKCLDIASGLLSGTPEDIARLNVADGDSSITLADATRLARKAAGLDSNP